MRIAVIMLLSLCCAGGAFAAEPRLAGRDIAAAVDVPQQEEQAGLADVLWELRGERGNSTLIVLTHFPQGLSPAADAAVASFARTLHGDSYASVQEQSAFTVEQYLETLSRSIAEGEKSAAPAPLPERKERDWGNTFAGVTTWQLFSPSKAVASVVFREDSSGGGAHGNWVYTTISYELESGRELTLNDLLPGADEPAVALGTLVLRELRGGTVSEAEARDMDVDMARLALTPEGVRVFYAPYEIGSYADGEFIVNIPKAALLGVGAAPSLWGDAL